MAKYIKALDVWTYGDAIATGQIKLQKGQLIKLKSDNPKLSRFHSAKPWHIRAFHYLASILNASWNMSSRKKKVKSKAQSIPF